MGAWGRSGVDMGFDMGFVMGFDMGFVMGFDMALTWGHDRGSCHVLDKRS